MIRTTFLTAALMAASLPARGSAPQNAAPAPPTKANASAQLPPATQPTEWDSLKEQNRELKAQLAELQAKLRSLKEAIAIKPVRHLKLIEVGMTRAELFEFLSIHRNRIHVDHDLVTASTERVIVSFWGIGSQTETKLFRVHSGTGNGWQVVVERYNIPVRQSGSALITLEDGVVVMTLAS